MKYKVVKKSESRLMRFCSIIYALVTKNTKAVFMEKFTTTFRRTIYSPDPKNMSSSILKHEKKHIEQWEKYNFYTARYLVSKYFRAKMEVEAYFSTNKRSLDWFIERLGKFYKCDRKSVVEAWLWYHEKW